MATIQTRQEIPGDLDEFTSPAEATTSPMKIYIAGLTGFVEGIPDDDFGFAKKIGTALDKTIADGATAPAAFVRRLGRRARRELTDAASFIRNQQAAARAATQSSGFGFGSPGSSQSSAASSVVKGALATVGKQVATADDAMKEAQKIVSTALASIDAADKVIAACATNYDGPWKLLGNAAGVATMSTEKDLVLAQVKAAPRPAAYALEQFQALLEIEDWDRADLFAVVCKQLIAELLCTPQPVLALQRGVGSRSDLFANEHALAMQLRSLVERYEAQRRPDALAEGTIALDAIKNVFQLIAGTHAVWLGRRERVSFYSTEARDGSPPWSQVVPLWQQRWLLPPPDGVLLGQWTPQVAKLLVPPSRTK
jgi:hypothetical protein